MLIYMLVLFVMKVVEIVLEPRAEDGVGYGVGEFSLLIIGSCIRRFCFKRFVVIDYRRGYY